MQEQVQLGRTTQGRTRDREARPLVHRGVEAGAADAGVRPQLWPRPLAEPALRVAAVHIEVPARAAVGMNKGRMLQDVVMSCAEVMVQSFMFADCERNA